MNPREVWFSTSSRRKQPETIVLEMLLNAIEAQVRFRGRERSGHEFHHARIGVQPLKGQPVGRAPAAQEEPPG